MRAVLIAILLAAQFACSSNDYGPLDTDAGFSDTGIGAPVDDLDSGSVELPESLRWSLDGDLVVGTNHELLPESRLTVVLFLEEGERCMQDMLLNGPSQWATEPDQDAVGWWLDLQPAPSDTMAPCLGVDEIRLWVGLAPYTSDLLPYLEPQGLDPDTVLALLIRTTTEGDPWLIGAAEPSAPDLIDTDTLNTSPGSLTLHPFFGLPGHP